MTKAFSHLGTREDNYARASEKKQIVGDWLLRYHYSTTALLRELLGMNTRSNNTFSRWVKQGFLAKIEWPQTHSFIYVLTPHALSEIEDLQGYGAFYTSAPSKINFNLVRHSLGIQRVAVDHFTEVVNHRPDRLISRLSTWKGKIPDLLLEYPDRKRAIELELTAKSDSRIFRAFVEHLRGLRDGRYNQVTYVFPTYTLLNYYNARFDREEWPIYRMDEKRRHWTPTGDSVSTTDFRQRFDFVQDERI